MDFSAAARKENAFEDKRRLIRELKKNNTRSIIKSIRREKKKMNAIKQRIENERKREELKLLEDIEREIERQGLIKDGIEPNTIWGRLNRPFRNEEHFIECKALFSEVIEHRRLMRYDAEEFERFKIQALSNEREHCSGAWEDF